MKNKLNFIFLIVLLIINYPLNAQSEKNYNQSDYIWNLTELYESEKEWRKDYDLLRKKIDNGNFNHIKKITSSNQLAKELNAILKLRTLSSKVSYYAILKWEEGKAENREELLEKGESLLQDFEALIAEAENKILSIGKENLKSWLAKNKSLHKHRHWLNLIIDRSDYLSTPEVEYTVRKIRNWISNSINTYWEIQNIDKLWPIYKDNKGKAILLNRSNYRKLRRSNDTTYRNTGAQLYYESLSNVSSLMGKIYTAKIKAELDLAKIRKFDNGIDANWFFNAGIPKGGYKVMLNAARKNKKTIQRYAKIRAKVLKQKHLHYLDFYKTPQEITNHQFSFNQSIDIGLEASKLISNDFYNNMKFALSNKNWMHLADVPKTARYHIRPPSGNIHPFLILKYQPRHIESRGLVGALFALVKTIPQIGADGTFVMEQVPFHVSGVLYAGDLLHDKILVSKIKSNEQKKAFLIESLEFLRGFYRYILWLELDEKIQSMVLLEKPISGDEISAYFLKTMRDYYGHEEGITYIPDYLKNDWMTDTYVSFMPKYEHHLWGSSIAAAAVMINEKKKSQVKKLFMQGFGNEKYDSFTFLKNNGIDLMKEETYNYIFNYMNSLMDEIDSLLK